MIPTSRTPDGVEPSGLELAVGLREGSVSAVALAERYLERIEAENGELGAFVSVSPARALRAAAQADRRLAERREVLPTFLGVPTAIKDIDPTRFDFTRFGSRALRWVWTPFDAEVPACFRAAGFTFLGKTATSELALLPTCETDIHPPCRNPWNREHTAGGSSGGAACAVASGMLPVAHGSDGGGSIRIPAAYNGLFGYKPGIGATPSFFDAIDPAGLSQVNGLTWTVDDAAALGDLLNGLTYDPRHPPIDSLLARSRGAPPRLRVAMILDAPDTDVDPENRAAAEALADRLRHLGHRVSAGPDRPDRVAEFRKVYGHIMGRVPLPASKLQPATRYIREEGRGVSRADALRIALDLRRELDALWGEVDLWLTPTTAVPPPRIGAWRGLSGEEVFDRAVPVGVFTAVHNIGGQPAATLPMGLRSDGLPVGAQLAARRGEDALLLQVCRELEPQLAWRSAAVGG